MSFMKLELNKIKHIFSCHFQLSFLVLLLGDVVRLTACDVTRWLKYVCSVIQNYLIKNSEYMQCANSNL